MTSVDLREGRLLTKLVINTKGEEYTFENASNIDEYSPDIASFVKDKLAKRRDDSGSEDDPIDQIRRLQELNEEGAISDEEFEKKKEDLLGDI